MGTLFDDAVRLRNSNLEQRQIIHNNNLNAQGPILVIPDKNDPTIGIGWFYTGTAFVAYQKYANGWSLYSVAVMTCDTVKQLHDAMHNKKTRI